uniref:BTB domain-containing protein n=1 Tax=Chromera velia CCMP2878 TaxID=1169474 RepID=A0A0G4HZD6_9ALVE|eukprot:Cvel_9714.t1-p1 / transcript=Cvel_9714.t1 / gene=Cvel_9714 / organism=Chromera_velia_CCMP2878 / gene_product=Kelch repeat and BTB domain-containing protein 4, putative / transcript_product=Kelch repeat and BTB domain-containing protein 4, putative / location=Cvel_scaffold567:15602-17568(+) / protein_length=531 / sequence_SO=supercontig / SO=protein_coding / is_pseudo=false
MSSSCAEPSCLASFGSSLRQLCVLDEDSVLFCQEGDTNVYIVSVSELELGIRVERNPGKLFCSVPYVGIPVVVKTGGKIGRLVVVVPQSEKVDKWVVAPDRFSQTSVPSPVKGPWNSATFFKDSVHLYCPLNHMVHVVPREKVIPLEWSQEPSPPPSALECQMRQCQDKPPGCLCKHVLSETGCAKAFPVRVGWTAPQMAFLASTANCLCWSDGAKTYASRLAQAPSNFEVHSDTEGEVQITAMASGENGFIFGTREGAVFQRVEKNWHARSGQKGPFVSIPPDSEAEREGEAEESGSNVPADPRRIDTIAVLSEGKFLFSRGGNLFVWGGGGRGEEVLTEKSPLMVRPRVYPVSPMLTSMRRLVFEGGDGADVEMVAKDDPLSCSQRVFGIRGMMSAICPFFQSTFKSGFREAHESILPIGDTSFEALRCVVLYLHTDVVELRGDFAVDVIELCRRFGLQWLRSEARKYAKKNMTVDNWRKMLLAAERHGFANLRALCIGFAAKNIQRVRDQPEFAELSQETLREIIKVI